MRTPCARMLAVSTFALFVCSCTAGVPDDNDPPTPDASVADAGLETTIEDAGVDTVDAGGDVCDEMPTTCRGNRDYDLCASCLRGHCVFGEDQDDGKSCKSGLDPHPECGPEVDLLSPGTGEQTSPFVTGASLRLPDVDGPNPLVSCEGGFVWTLFLVYLPSDEPSEALLVIEGAQITVAVNDFGPRQTDDHPVWALHLGGAEVCLPHGP